MVSPDAIGAVLVSLIQGITELAPALPGGVEYYQDNEAWIGKAAYAMPIGKALVAYLGADVVEAGGAALQHQYAIYVRPQDMTYGSFLFHLVNGKPAAANGQTFANYFFAHQEWLEIQNAARIFDEDNFETFEIRVAVNDRNWVE